MDAVFSLLFGPLGQSFRIFKEYGVLPKDFNFIEFSDELYERYTKLIGTPDDKLFLLIPLDLVGKDREEVDVIVNNYILENRKELPTVTETEKIEMMKAAELVFKITEDLPCHTSDQERIDNFLNVFTMFK